MTEEHEVIGVVGVSRALTDLLETLAARGSEYGSAFDDKANLRESHLVGVDPVLGVVVRMGDKWARIRNLIQNDGSPHQVREQFLDLAGYSIKAMELLDERLAFAQPYVGPADGDGVAAGRESGDYPNAVSLGRRWVRSLLGG